MTIVFDRIASVGGWLHAVDERDLGTELPLRNEDFESEVRTSLRGLYCEALDHADFFLFLESFQYLATHRT